MPNHFTLCYDSYFGFDYTFSSFRQAGTRMEVWKKYKQLDLYIRLIRKLLRKLVDEVIMILIYKNLY